MHVSTLVSSFFSNAVSCSQQTVTWSAFGVSFFGTWLKLVWVAPKISRLRSWQTLDAVAFSSSKLCQLFFNHTVNLMVAPATLKIA